MKVDATNAAEVAAELKRIQAEFARPFDPADVKLKPQAVKGDRALAIHYVTARAVMDRLDDVVGVGGWEDAYTVHAHGEVECRLSVRVGTEWVTKCDVGGQSEQPDEGDRLKAAYSDALKRAAVKFGIGRYLYRLPQQWMDYDPVKRMIIPQSQFPKPKPAPAATDAPTTWAVNLVKRLDEAARREDGRWVWEEYEKRVKANAITPADKAAIVAAFTRFGEKFPAPAKA